jgi:hypothetical protein
MELIEERNTIEKSFLKVLISLLYISILTFLVNIEDSKLIARLAVSSLCCLSEILNSFGEIFRNTES